MTNQREGGPLSTQPIRPIIEGLTPYDEVDLDELGSDDLVVRFTYDSIEIGDQVSIRWSGADYLGAPVEYSLVIDIEPSNFDPSTGWAQVVVLNQFVIQARDGYAFFSFTPPSASESLRAFCFVGVRWGRFEQMPVAQVRESHALFIDSRQLGAAGATVLVPPYSAMQVGDQVTLFFVGYESDGAYDDTWQRTLSVTADLLGRPLSWSVPRGQFGFIEQGHAEIHYEVAFRDQSVRLQSPVQTFRIDPVPAMPAPLPALTVDGYSGGPLDPVLFPNGLTLRVPAYAQAMVNDWLMLHVDDDPAQQHQRLDLSSLESGMVFFQLPAQRLEGLARLSLAYQLAREGLAWRSEVLEIELVLRREFPALSVRNAVSETVPDEPIRAVLAGNFATAGALVDFPDIQLQPDESLEVYWEGRSAMGTAVIPLASVPEQGLPIEKWHVAANLEDNPGSREKRFPVYYKVLPAGYESEHLHLSITPLPQSNYPTIRCTPNRGSSIHLADITGAHATLTLDSWPFMSAGQILNITIAGVVNGGTYPVNLRKSAVTAEEVARNEVVVLLDKSTLEALDNNSTFTLNVSANFEGDPDSSSWTRFEYPQYVIVK
ncbi:hypothetical protein [Pseudomonas faucium]|uniref:hypothetical protein n=1 Tax=Pseudomonas faucium TaxID=2740518 RepID=UPI001F28A142|nr:hypothetical protein [Pseudomonas faucium]